MTGDWGLWDWQWDSGNSKTVCTGLTPTKTDWDPPDGDDPRTSRVSPCWACTSNCQGRKG